MFEEMRMFDEMIQERFWKCELGTVFYINPEYLPNTKTHKSTSTWISGTMATQDTRPNRIAKLQQAPLIHDQNRHLTVARTGLRSADPAHMNLQLAREAIHAFDVGPKQRGRSGVYGR